MKCNYFIGLKPKSNKKCDLLACPNTPNFIFICDLEFENFTRMILYLKKTRKITMMILSLFSNEIYEEEDAIE